jgi:hypothetical protein
MNEVTALQVRAVELRRLLDKSSDDPVLAPQLRDRLDEAERALEAARTPRGEMFPQEPPKPPRAAFFLRGREVHDSEGIRPSLAGEILIQYERMFTEQALHDERVAAKEAGRERRPRGAATPSLIFTGTPRGSFGMEFVPRSAEDFLVAVHAKSLSNVADALIRVADSDSTSFKDVVGSIPARMLQPLKQFLKTLAQHEAELRFAFEDQPSRSLSVEQVRGAAELLERDVEQETITVTGVFRGATLDSGYFDLRTETGKTISGTVADHLTEEDLERFDELINKRCVAVIQETVVRDVAGEKPSTYVLIDVKAV